MFPENRFWRHVVPRFECAADGAEAQGLSWPPSIEAGPLAAFIEPHLYTKSTFVVFLRICQTEIRP
jgi:hypothetical protein